MHVNTYSATASLEAIDYQKDNFFQELSGLFSEYKLDKINESRFKETYSKMVRNRFNIKTLLIIEEQPELNASMRNIVLDEKNVLFVKRWGMEIAKLWGSAIIKDNKKTMARIAKGELPHTGLLDYKRAKLNGLFAELPHTHSYITRGALNNLTPEELAATMLHEIGHYWTYLEFLGLYTGRNAIIDNTVKEYLEAKNPEEKIQLILEANNAYGLTIDEQITKTNDDDATKVIVGSMCYKLFNGVGYVQYDSNIAEAVADQFAMRMGCGYHLATVLDKVHYSYRDYRFYVNHSIFSIALFIIFCIVIGVGAFVTLSSAFAPLVGVSALGLSGYTAMKTSALICALGSNRNGGVYDNPKDRIKRVYNELLGTLKKVNLSADETKMVLKQIEQVRSVVDNSDNLDTVVDRILRICSSNFREQEKKKLYQQLTEELLANELYVTSAKFKTLGA